MALPRIFVSGFIALALVTTMGCPGSSGGGSGGGAKGPFTVTFNRGNAPASASNESPPANMSVESGQKLVLPGRGTLHADASTNGAAPGPYFIGWSRSNKPLIGEETFADAVKRVAGAPGEALDISADTTLYAVYVTTSALPEEKVAGIDLVAFPALADGSTTDVVSPWPTTPYATKVAVGQKIAPYTVGKPERPSHDWLGWATPADGMATKYAVGVAFSVGTAIPATGNFQVYGVFTPVTTTHQSKITYNVNGGTGAPTTVTGTTYSDTQAQPVLSIDTINLNSPVPTTLWAPPTGKAFLGWTDVAPVAPATVSTGAAKYFAGDTYKGASITIYAVWSNCYTVILDSIQMHRHSAQPLEQQRL